MKTREYMEDERQIAAGEGRTTAVRWRWGRRLLADPTAVNSAGTLRRGNGTVEILVAAARAKGFNLSKREIQYRLACARAYQTAAQSAAAAALYGSWKALCAAGFPPVDGATEADPEPAPPEPPMQGTFEEMCPAAFNVDGKITPIARTPLRRIGVHVAEQESTTLSLRTSFDQLVEAAGGDLDVTYREARALLASSAGEDAIAT